MKLFLGIPAYGMADPLVLQSFFRLGVALTKAGHSLVNDALTIEIGDSNHARAMNHLLHWFLSSDADRALFVDLDQVFDPRHALDLLDVDEDFVSGLYCRRAMPEGRPVGMKLHGGDEMGPLVEMSTVGTGFFALTRSCAQALSDDAIRKGRVFLSGHAEGLLVAAPYDQGLSAGCWRSADEIITESWRALGGKVWLHTGVRVGHVGTHVY